MPSRANKHILPQINVNDASNYEDNQKKFTKIMPRKNMKINLPDLAHNHKIMDFQNSLSELKSNQKLLSAIKESSINIHEPNSREEN